MNCGISRVTTSSLIISLPSLLDLLNNKTGPTLTHNDLTTLELRVYYGETLSIFILQIQNSDPLVNCYHKLVENYTFFFL